MVACCQAGVDLVITVDCGSVSKEEVEYGEKLGLKILVTDHHRADNERLPQCPVINPNQPGCEYTFKGLAGCGVAFKLAQGVARTIGLQSFIVSTISVISSSEVLLKSFTPSLAALILPAEFMCGAIPKAMLKEVTSPTFKPISSMRILRGFLSAEFNLINPYLTKVLFSSTRGITSATVPIATKSRVLL